MIAVDASILVYAHRTDSPFHAKAAPRLMELGQSSNRWSIPWPCLHEFIALVTNARVFVQPTALERVFETIAGWRGSPGLAFLGEGEDHLERLHDLAVAGRVSGGMIHDASIAAICLSHGVTEFWTADRDFGRFPKLRIRNPLL